MNSSKILRIPIANRHFILSYQRHAGRLLASEILNNGVVGDSRSLSYLETEVLAEIQGYFDEETKKYIVQMEEIERDLHEVPWDEENSSDT